MKKSLVSVFTITLLFGCGGGSGESNAVDDAERPDTRTPFEIEHNLPVEPDPEVNNSTINGVDSNQNDIRDDWERAIVYKYHEDPVKLKLHKDFAKTSTLINQAYEKKDLEAYKEYAFKLKHIIECGYYIDASGASENMKLFRMHSNTEERLEYSLDRSSYGSLESDYWTLTPDEELETICQKYHK